MSEYQYYEFQAIDRPLTREEMQALRAVSSRAVITPTRFTNHYEWGSFKGDPSAWMKRYFDAFLYFANWGTHELMLRLPLQVLDLATARRYCRGEAAMAWATGEHVVLAFRSEDENAEWVEEDEDNLAAFTPLRQEIASSDLRALYLGWLLCVQGEELADAEEEPPCPPGLGSLSGSLEAFAAFLRVDDDLLAAAAAGSPEAETVLPAEAVKRWVASLPEAEKTTLLARFVAGSEPHLRAELVRRWRELQAPAWPAMRRRAIGELRADAMQRAEARRRREAELAAQERARKEREAAAIRERYLGALAPRETKMWEKVEALVATKQPRRYDEAVALIVDLREIAVRAGRQAEAAARIARLRELHARKPSFLDRLRAAGL
jgi:hypothetical protein